MKEKQLPRRIIQYICGLVCMAIGLVLLKRTVWGVSPITAVPDAVANITPLTLGNATILLHLLCVVLQIVVQRRVTLKSVLTMCVGVPFGYLVDFFMWLWNPTLNLWQKCIALVLGIAIQGFGVALISGCDLMLPAPDELNNVIARTYDKKLSNVKMIADAIYVVTAIVINLIFQHSLASVGISSIASVLLTGRFIGLTLKLFPRIKMEPFFNANAAPKESA
ncbi:MAG: hypothetical protein IJ751_02755 [Oscillospiraceae bacterium]|nr:hypothetical protein [Oscillospiraceae bacterium]